jgi:hypothetical protein
MRNESLRHQAAARKSEKGHGFPWPFIRGVAFCEHASHGEPLFPESPAKDDRSSVT